MLDKARLISFVIGFSLGIIVAISGMALSNRVQPAPIMIEAPAPTSSPQPTEMPGPIRVHVNGQVAEPAVYELAPGSIVETAVMAAGGFTDLADTSAVNLAQPLADGVQVYVPARNEVTAAPVSVVIQPTDASGEASTAVDASSNSGLVNINSATTEALDSLPGIGPSTAQKIVEYRDSNGPFASIESLMDVSGIGEAKFSQIKDLITIEAP